MHAEAGRNLETALKTLRAAKVAAWVVIALIVVAGASASITYYVTMKTINNRAGAGTTTTYLPTTNAQTQPAGSAASATHAQTQASAGTTESQASTPTTSTQTATPGNTATESTTTEAPATQQTPAHQTSAATQNTGGGAATVESYESLLNTLSREYSNFQLGSWAGGYGYILPVTPLVNLMNVRGAEASPAVAPATTTTVEVTSVKNSANPQTPPHSTTNVQVPGVGEADIVKNDGKYLYVVGRPEFVGASPRKPSSIRTAVYIVEAYPPSKMRVVGKVVVEGDVAGIYVKGDELIVINRTSAFWAIPLVRPLSTAGSGVVMPPPIVVMPLMSWRTGVLAYNISNRSSPKLMWSHYVSGSYLTSRMIGNTLYLMTVQPALTILVNGSKLLRPPAIDGKVLPSSRVRVVRTLPLQPWLNSFVTVACVNIVKGGVNASSYLMPRPQRVYVSKDSIYLISSEWLFMNLTLTVLRNAVIPALPKNLASQLESVLSNSSAPIPYRVGKAVEAVSKYLRGLSREDLAKVLGRMYSGMFKTVLAKPLTATLIYRLSLKGMEASLKAKATVPGRILDQFAMREERGYFIVATTSTQYVDLRITGTGWGGIPMVVPVMGSVNSVYVLNATTLKKVSSLTGLAKGERVFSARFVGNYLFLVTYRSVDPLFAINLTNPRKPEVVGYVKVPGFSRYLHPYGSHYLIGVGYMTEGGRIVGIKVSMYDVSNPRDIRVAARVVIKATWAYTNVAWNYKAFLLNPAQGYLAIPVTIYNLSSGKYSAGSYLYVIKVGNGTMKLLGRIREAGVVRAAYIGNYVYAISRAEIKAAAIPTLKVVASVKLG